MFHHWLHIRFARTLILTLQLVVLLTKSKATTAMTMSQPRSDVRVELFFKGKEDLKERIRFLSSHGISSYNIVNKSRQDTIEEWVDAIQQEVEAERMLANLNSNPISNPISISICAHYSLKFNRCPPSKGRGREETSYQKFLDFIQSEPLLNNNHNNHNEVLLISGSGDKAKLDPINVLQRLSTSSSSSSTSTSISSDEKDFRQEQQ